MSKAVSEQERAEKLARARAKLKKHQQSSSSNSRPSSTGVPSPTLSDKAPLPSIEDGLFSSIVSTSDVNGISGTSTNEVPASLFDSSAAPHDDFFSNTTSPRVDSTVTSTAEKFETPLAQEAAMATSAAAILSPVSPARSTASLSDILKSPRTTPSSVHDQTIKLLVSEKAQLVAHLEALQLQLEDREASSRKAKESADEHISKLKELESALAQETARLGEGVRARADLQEKLSTLERQASVAQRTGAALQASLEERDATINTLKAELAADDKVSDLEARLRTKTSHADTLEAEVSKLRTVHSRLKADKDAADAHLKRLEEASSNSSAAQKERELEWSRLEEELAASSSAISEAQKMAQKQSEEAKALRESSTAAQSQLEHSQTELENVRTALTTAQDLLKSAESTAFQAVTRRESLQMDNDSLVAQVNELREKTVALTDELLAAREKHDAAQRSLRERDTLLAKAKAAAEEDAARLQSLEAQMSDRERQLTQAQDRGERLERDAQYAQDDARAREQELNELKTKLTRSDSEIGRFKTGAEARISELHALEAELEAARQELQSEKEERLRLEDDITQMQDASADLQNQIEELRQRQPTPQGSAAPSIHTTEGSPAHGLSPLMAVRDASPNGVPSPIEPVPVMKLSDAQSTQELEASLLRSQLSSWEGRALAEEERATELSKQVTALQAEVAKLEDVVSVERGRALRAMREAFAVGAASETSPLPSPLRTPSNSTSHLLTPSRIGAASPDATPLGQSSSWGSHRRAHTEAYLPSSSVHARNDFPFPLPSPTTSSARSSVSIAAPPKRASHARRVSLHLLKSRMEDELGLPDIALVSATPDVGAMHTRHDSEEGRFSGEYRHHHRPRAQLGDDLVWCACCKGDLLVL